MVVVVGSFAAVAGFCCSHYHIPHHSNYCRIVQMKTLVAIALLFATSASADTVRATIKDHYEWQDVNIPITQTYCKQKSGGQGALEGMIIGGLLGKGITGDDEGAIGGAVIGGIIGADKAGRKCWDETTYYTETTQVYAYSTITFTQDGQTYTVDFYK
jgi:uncharacterized protein YcfJ